MKVVSSSCPVVLLPVLLVLTLAQSGAQAQVSAVPPLINFQGRLAKPDGTPVANGTYSIKFTLFTAATGGTQKWTETDTVAVKNGVFAAQLGKATALSGALFASSLWLEVKVGTDPALTPRQPLVSVAYAFKADTVPDGSIGATQLANGAVTSAKLASGILNPLAWLLGGNSGTTSSSFLGTKDNRPLEMRVNNHRAMQFTYIEDTSNPGNEFRTLNVLGGSEINSISPGVFGATIVGGGQDYFTGTDYPNTVTDNFGTVVGGSLNTANGFSFVGGGYNNKATEFYSTIVGGTFNIASNNQTFIGGGILNTASGFGATVPGGEGNTASGTFSLAAGNGAQALHDGSFVWADSSVPGTPVTTTAANQFMVRAAGGIYLQGFTNVQSIMQVDAGLTVDNADISAGAVSNGLRFGHFSGEGLASNRTGGSNQFGLDLITAFFPRMSITNNGFVGVGTTAPQTALHVKGFEGAFNLEGIEGSDHVYMQFFPRGYAAGRKAYFGFPSQGSHDLVLANEDGGAVEVIGNFVNNSDARWKTNVSPLANALESVLNLRGVSYDWRQDIPGKRFAEGRQIGFLAQEVEGVLPELVHTGRDGYKSVAYVNLVPVLVEAMKTQEKRLREVEAENATFKAQLSALSARLTQMETEKALSK